MASHCQRPDSQLPESSGALSWPTTDADVYRQLRSQECDPTAVCDWARTRERQLCANWIVRACSDYGFREDVPAAAVLFFDRLMSRVRKQPGMADNRFKDIVLMFVGNKIDIRDRKHSSACEIICIVCITIAAKKLEPRMSAPFLGDFEGYHSFADLRSIETLVLNSLQWDLTSCTAVNFLHHWLPRLELQHREQIQILGNKILLRCLSDPELAQIWPRYLGAASVVWAHAVLQLDAGEWQKSCELNLHEVESVVDCMAAIMSDEYPEVLERRRSRSPVTIMGVQDTISCTISKINNSPQPGLKRPIPQRSLGNDHSGSEPKRPKVV